ncbi:hypothetical protein TNCV_1578231 [Trichonephila clavipes]|nr:hypothetical protein TNCV_1578231 [Trichonephila clavipes]
MVANSARTTHRISGLPTWRAINRVGDCCDNTGATANGESRSLWSAQLSGPLGTEVHEQMFRSGGQSDTKLPMFSPQVSLVVIYRPTEKPKNEGVSDGIDRPSRKGLRRGEEKCTDWRLFYGVFRYSFLAVKFREFPGFSRRNRPLVGFADDYRRFFRLVHIDGLRCSGKSLSPSSGNEGKREIVLNRRPELLSMCSTKDQLVKRRFYACETQCFPVEPSGCRRDSPVVSMKKEKRDVPLRTAYSQAGRFGSQSRAEAQLETRTETVETFELVKVEPKLLREKKRERERRASRRYLLHIIVKLIC